MPAIEAGDFTLAKDLAQANVAQLAPLAQAGKKILAINTDPEANMVTKADYAVIGDLHKVIPAITAEIRRRRG